VAGTEASDALTEYKVTLQNPNKAVSQVAVKIEFKPGYFGGGAIPGYIRQTCGKGEITTGDWSDTDGLKSYSGGAWYRKVITIDSTYLKNDLEIDLGDLVSSAELFVNGKSAGIRLAPPWTFNISDFVISGKNDIDVLIYNTLANNYIAVPTRFRGSIKSGLIGPVKIISSH
jgi:hypothetical protein